MQVDEIIEKIIRICKKYGAEKVVLFGSRAKGTQTARSDIDIAVSAVASGDIFDLEEELLDIPTLYRIDLVDLDTCKNDLLLEDIKQYSVLSSPLPGTGKVLERTIRAGRSIEKKSLFRNCLNFHQGTLGEGGYLKGGSSRTDASKILGVYLIHGIKVRDVLQQNGGFYHPF